MWGSDTGKLVMNAPSDLKETPRTSLCHPTPRKGTEQQEERRRGKRGSCLDLMNSANTRLSEDTTRVEARARKTRNSGAICKFFHLPWIRPGLLTAQLSEHLSLGRHLGQRAAWDSGKMTGVGVREPWVHILTS